MATARHFWTVRCSVWVEGRGYKGQETFGVVAPSVLEAVAEIERNYPEVEIWAVNHHGKIKHYTPPLTADG